MTDVRIWVVERRMFKQGGEDEMWRLGTVCFVPQRGFRFFSNVASHGNSRKDHPTFDACLPRWVGYPDRCETRRVE